MSTTRIHERYTLNATERLKLRKQIETLFQSGKASSIVPLRVLFLLVPKSEGEQSPIRIGFSIPKKRIRKAVARNRMRRLLKEAWRLQKLKIYPLVPEHLQLHVFFIYTGKEKFNFEQAFEVVGKVISELEKKIKA